MLPPVVLFKPSLTLLEVPLTLIESLSLDTLAALLPRHWIFILDGGRYDGAVGRSKGYKGCEGECEDNELGHFVIDGCVNRW